MPDRAPDPSAVLEAHDIGRPEVHRRAGGSSGAVADAVRQRLAALIEPFAVAEPAAESKAADIRQAGALIVRLGGAATAETLAEWLGWSLERCHAALAVLDRRLDACGLRLQADSGGHLHVGDRARLRSRPRQLPSNVLGRLDDPAYRHALAHLVRGEPCPAEQDWSQALLDLGVAVVGGYPGVTPTEGVAAAFVAVSRRYAYPSPDRQPTIVVTCE